MLEVRGKSGSRKQEVRCQPPREKHGYLNNRRVLVLHSAAAALARAWMQESWPGQAGAKDYVMSEVQRTGPNINPAKDSRL